VEDPTTKILIGFAFKIFNELGYGLPEKTYQKALETCLVQNNIIYNREKYSVIEFNGVKVGRYYLDFLINNNLAVELKVRNQIYESDIKQLLGYLKSENIKLGLLLVFAKEGVLIKRIIN